MIKHLFSSFILLLGLAQPALAKSLVNTDSQGLALEGYDPVAFHTEGKPVRGRAEFTSRHEGATYRFASAENRDRFAAEPARYAPAYGGYCAYGVSKGGTYPVEIDTWQITDGRLVLNYNRKVQETFNRKPAEYLAKADANWSGLVESKGK